MKLEFFKLYDSPSRVENVILAEIRQQGEHWDACIHLFIAFHQLLQRMAYERLEDYGSVPQLPALSHVAHGESFQSRDQEVLIFLKGDCNKVKCKMNFPFFQKYSC